MPPQIQCSWVDFNSIPTEHCYRGSSVLHQLDKFLFCTTHYDQALLRMYDWRHILAVEPVDDASAQRIEALLIEGRYPH